MSITWPGSDLVILEAIKALFGLSLLAAGWFVGQRVIASWEVRKKRDEMDVTSAVQFQQLYGELKEVSRLWRERQRAGVAAWSAPADLRWSLLARATAAESKYEAVLMKLASERDLEIEQKKTLGLFRQACQKLRLAIRRNHNVPWSDLSPSYLLFNDLAAEVTCLVGTLRPRKSIQSRQASDNLRAIAKIRTKDWQAAVESYGPVFDKETAFRPAIKVPAGVISAKSTFPGPARSNDR